MCDEMRNVYKILLWRPLRRHRHRWKDNIIIDIKELGFEDVD
jgi:hypothetical protein